MAWGQGTSHRVDHFKNGFGIGNEQLDDVTRFRDFGGRSQKIRFGFGSPVPDGNRKAGVPKVARNTRTDDSQTDDSDSDAFSLTY